MNSERILLAEEFLREAVYRSRERQSARHSLQGGLAGGSGTCGLGEQAAVALDLSPRGVEVFDLLFASTHRTPTRSEELHAVMTAWIERQDALDRKRNHFIKAFRGRHGLDRTRYAPEAVREFEIGLSQINAEEDSERRAAAEGMIARGS